MLRLLLANKRFYSTEPLRVHWYYASDTPLSKSTFKAWKPSSPPAKFVPFPARDSARLEAAFRSTEPIANNKNNNNKSSHEGEPMAQSRDSSKNNIKVSVLEDALYEVDVHARTLYPIYWDGPTYEVRRGSWFVADGSTTGPIPEPLAQELEKLYANVEPKKSENNNNNNNNKLQNKDDNDDNETSQAMLPLKTTLHPDNILKSVSPVYACNLKDSSLQTQEPDAVETLLARGAADSEALQKMLDQKKSGRAYASFSRMQRGTAWLTPGDLGAVLLRKLVSLGGIKLTRGYVPPSAADKASDLGKAAAEAAALSVERPVDHLVICLHGIGQKLNERIEQVNFVQDINVFRKLLRHVYKESTELQEKRHGATTNLGKIVHSASAATTTKDQGHGIQVIPLIWRHNVQFGMTRKDIEVNGHGEVSLEDINVDGVLPLRSIVGDVVLDVLLYYQPQYHEQIMTTVVKQLNGVFGEYCKRNPTFAQAPRVSLVGHSLGSAIAFDILCAQGIPGSPQLDFDVDIFFGVGSPVGMFQLLKGNHIAARLDDNDDDDLSKEHTHQKNTDDPQWPAIQSPKVKDYYNIFHPSDPVAYRVDPLVHRDAASLPARKVPYAPGTLPSQLAQFSQLASRFSSEATSLWSNVTAALIDGNSSLASLANVFTTTTTTTTTNNKSKQKQEDLSLAVARRAPFDSLPKETQEAVHKKLSKLNHTGQLDYAFQGGVLEISVFTAIASHVSYFEQADLASFLLASIYSLNNGGSNKRREKKKKHEKHA
ncbi:uncharacterized protein SAPINGB_P005784 [Magnusiomyces paraingens]|uniref:DDHD domain-containing protein n=1 Tax=Magnusiomyces paraingens TaxID=2606893 RepID=A0A5E8C8J8_9ASCO|nr:uncharacterized protein SAPINGB_P005784 [Saprochaete ingens]VVT57616.1 unnamed protein product [Saprochaete ingens]